MPMAARAVSGSRAGSTPATRRAPEVGRSSVARMRRSVVLPAPFDPRRVSPWPAARSRDTSSRTRVAPYILRRRRAWIMRRERVGGGGLPVPSGSELHRLEAGDSLLDGRVGGEERGEPARGQRVDDEEVRGGRRGGEGILLRGSLELLERVGQPRGFAHEPSARRIRFRLA